MSPDRHLQSDEDGKEDFIKAQQALSRNKPHEAKRFLHAAVKQGFDSRQTDALQRKIDNRLQTHTKREKGAWVVLFLVGGVIYLFFSLQSPRQWSIPVWITIGFVLIPAVLGFATRSILGPESLDIHRRKSAFWGCALSTGWYSFLSMVWARTAVGWNPSGEAAFGLIVGFSALYGAIGGVIAALCAGIPIREGSPR